MKTKGIVLSLMTSALVNLPAGFAADLSTSKLKNSNTSFELTPVKFTDKESKSCMEYEGKCLLPFTKKPVLVLEDFQYQTFAENRLGIKLVLDEKKARSLNKLSKKYINSKLAVVHNGKVLMAPTMKSIIKDGKFEITFNDQKKFDEVLENLSQ